jgi:serine protease inhibitor ecotin
MESDFRGGRFRLTVLSRDLKIREQLRENRHKLEKLEELLHFLCRLTIFSYTSKNIEVKYRSDGGQKS